jgi:molybdate transport system regulatory protein
MSAGRHRSPRPLAAILRRATVRTKVWLELDGQFVIGEGGLELLGAVAAHGSLARAAAEVGWSYRHAWGYLRRAEQRLQARLTMTVPGKGRRRGTRLSPAGVVLVTRLGALRDAVKEVARLKSWV